MFKTLLKRDLPAAWDSLTDSIAARIDTAVPKPQRKLRVPQLGPYRYVRRRWHVLFTLFDAVGWSLVLACRALRAMFGLAQPAAAGEPRRILLLQVDHLGDAILSTGMLRALRQRYRQAKIEVLTGPWNQTLFEAMPEVDQVHVTSASRFTRGRRGSWLLGVLVWGWKLRRRKFDLAIDVRGDFPLAVLMRLTGARRRLGWDAGGGGFLLSHSPAYVPGRPEVLSRQALLDELEIAPPLQRGNLPAAWSPSFLSPDADRQWARQELAWRDPQRPLVLIHVGAGMQSKRWPADQWRELLGRLIVEQQTQIVLVGGDDDREIAREVTGAMPWADVHDWTGRLSITQLAATLELADVLIGADSGPAHLAAAVGTPVVVLFSGTNSLDQWRPWAEQVRVVKQPTSCSPCHHEVCPLADHPCMSGLRPSAVLTATRKFLLGERPSTLNLPNWNSHQRKDAA